MATAFCASKPASSLVRSRRAARPARATRVVVRASAADRPVWFPGNPPPSYLDGTLAGDYGFDPLGLGSDAAMLKWYVQAELVHSRWAMLGVAGILFTSLGAKAGLGIPEWFEAGKVSIENGNAGFGTLLVTEFLLFGWVETKRWWDFKNPGSQGDGSFLGLTDALKGTANGYPGGIFDPMGFSKGADFAVWKQKEIKNGRLAMVATLGFAAQYAATGKGPIDNLIDHVSDPTHVTFATNGVSVPILS